MLLLETGAGCQVQPVGIHSGLVHTQFCGGHRSHPRFGIAFSGRGGIGIFQCFRLILPEFNSIHEVGEVDGIVNGDVGVVGYGQFAFFTSLGADEDDAVRTAGTIDGSRRSIFQYFNGFDVVRIDFGPGTIKGNTVQNNQWFVVCRDGVLAADAGLGGRTFRIGSGH